LNIDGAPDTISWAEPIRTGSLNGSTLFRIGQAQRAGQADWNGRIDEVRLSSVVRDDSWTGTEYNNQLSPAAFYVLAAEEISPVITVDDVIVVEGDGLLFTVTLGGAAAGPFVVAATFTDVTATGGAAPLVFPEDYDNTPYLLSFVGTAGETQTFTIPTLDDAVLEPTETFTVSLNAVDPQVLDSDTGTGTINDNDATFPAACNVFVDQDAYLKESNPGENHGTDVELSLENNSSGDDKRLVYRYDLSAIPAGSLVVSAKVWYFITGEDSNGGVADVHRITDAWTEGGVSWTNTATDFDATVEGSFTPSVSSVWASTHVTSLVQSWVDGTVSNEGVMLLINQTDTESKYTSREWGTASERPCMEVTWIATTTAIVKRAFLSDGTPIPTGTSIPSGVEFKFLLYVNNAGAALSDISVRDALNAAFLYQPGTIQVDNSVAECTATPCTAGEELAIFTAVDGAPFLTDALGDDVVSYAAPFVDAGDGNAGNLQLDINADAVWAMLFSVKMP